MELKMRNLKIDKQITGLAGEYFVAAELLKRNYQVAMTLGNAKAIDLIATCQESGKTFEVQVKTLRKKPNCFTLHTSKIGPEHIYIFVYLNKEEEQTDYHIVKGSQLLSNKKHYYGASLGRADLRETVNHGPLKEHLNTWHHIK
jgi:hypothetical protein